MSRSRSLIAAAALAAALAPLSGARAAAPACPFEGETAAWATKALSAWDLVAETRLDLPPAPPPDIVFFDETCVFRLSASGPAPGGYRALDARVPTTHGTLEVWSAPHQSEIRLPDGQTAPVEPTSFAGQGPDGRPFFVMSLPSVFARVMPPERARRLLYAVLVHEISHVRQVDTLGRRLDGLTASGALPPDATDDIVQQRFSSDPAFSAAVAKETDLLYRAAAAPDLAETRRLAAEALAAMDARRARAYVGANGAFSEVEDLFLTFEGAGNWAGYAWLSDPKGGGLSSAAAIDLMRGSRKWWSQEQGLALFLTLDRLDPDWPDKVYGEQSALAVDLLRTALSRPQASTPTPIGQVTPVPPMPQ